MYQSTSVLSLSDQTTTPSMQSVDGMGNKSQWVNISSGVGVTTATFVNFSVSKIFNLAKVPVRLF